MTRSTAGGASARCAGRPCARARRLRWCGSASREQWRRAQGEFLVGAQAGSSICRLFFFVFPVFFCKLFHLLGKEGIDVTTGICILVSFFSRGQQSTWVLCVGWFPFGKGKPSSKGPLFCETPMWVYSFEGKPTGFKGQSRERNPFSPI